MQKLTIRNIVFNILLLGILYLSFPIYMSKLAYGITFSSQALLRVSVLYALWMGLLSCTFIIFGVRVLDDLSLKHNWSQKTKLIINYSVVSLALFALIYTGKLFGSRI